MLDFTFAEKSGCGNEEGQRQGPDNDDIVLGGFVHHPFCVGVPHLVLVAKPGPGHSRGTGNGSDSWEDEVHYQHIVKTILKF